MHEEAAFDREGCVFIFCFAGRLSQFTLGTIREKKKASAQASTVHL